MSRQLPALGVSTLNSLPLLNRRDASAATVSDR